MVALKNNAAALQKNKISQMQKKDQRSKLPFKENPFF